MSKYDTFFPNILETGGRIERKPYNFVAEKCKIWKGGVCIYEVQEPIKISAEVDNYDGRLHVKLDNSKISDFVSDKFSFHEISFLNDRLLWSTYLLDEAYIWKPYEPVVMGIFFYEGAITKINLNIYNPTSLLIELLSHKAIELEEGNLGNITFKSTRNRRYENGLLVGDTNLSNRLIQIEKNINGHEGYLLKPGDGYIVTIFNLDGVHPVWKNNIQMAPKPMRIIKKLPNKIILRGYPVKARSPFGWVDFKGQDYGLTIVFDNEGKIEKCILHLHDRNIDIEYL